MNELNENKKEKFFNSSMIRFIIVGLINTGISTFLMFLLHNRLGYWPATSISFIAGSISSFFMNRTFTFKSKDEGPKVAIKFIISLGVCYFFVYFIAHKLTLSVLGGLNIGLSLSTMEKWAMLFAQIIFPAFNYIGQRFFVFNDNKTN